MNAIKPFDYEYDEVVEPAARVVKRRAQPKVDVTVEPLPVLRDRSVLVETIDGRRILTPTPEAVGLFVSAKNAVRFAVTRDGAPARPPSSRMLDAMTGGRDFAGLDGAAQAGMIFNIIDALGRVPVAALVADAAPRSVPCSCRRPCCGGHRANSYWRDAIDTLAQEAQSHLPAGSKRSYALRSAIILKIYGSSETFKTIANQLHIDEETVSRHHRSLLTWLRGARAKNNAEGVLGVESMAWREAETLLRTHGIVG